MVVTVEEKSSNDDQNDGSDQTAPGLEVWIEIDNKIDHKKNDPDAPDNPTELPDCPKCGRCEWVFSTDGNILICPCGCSLSAREDNHE